MNQRYPRKRALYLAGLAQYLTASSDIGTMRYSCLHGNRLRPVLLLTPPGICLQYHLIYISLCGIHQQCICPLYLCWTFFFFFGLRYALDVSGKDSSSFTVRVHACPPPGFFKPSRFHPQRNNIRTDWYTGLQTALSGKIAHFYC